jgi:phage-related protein
MFKPRGGVDRLPPERPAQGFRGQSGATSVKLCIPPNRAKPIPSAKPLRGFGGGSVLEIVANRGGNSWRAVYTVRYSHAIYVLHAFQRKSKIGAATPQKEMDLIRQGLTEAERFHRERQN